MTKAPEAESSSELLFELSVPRRALPEDLTALEAGDWILEAGTDVTGEPQASQANESMRSRAMMVTSGSLLVEPTTEARGSGTRSRCRRSQPTGRLRTRPSSG